jgi:Zn-dependent peptidase ImmA (M78 family)
MRGDTKPTLKQLEHFAKTARVPLGYLFLPEPPEERLPIKDLRTVGSKGVRSPSPDLLDTIYLCQRRQEWYREYAEQNGLDPIGFVGTATLGQRVEEVAEQMRRTLDYDADARILCQDTADALRKLIERAEAAGILVMVSGVVKNITARRLDPDEFRGFALADPLAPLIFVNAADAKPAQLFTLAHELAHVWLGETALSNASLRAAGTNRVEAWCNRVAAEFLVPLAEIQAMDVDAPLDHMEAYTEKFHVSRFVILRRLRDAGLIDHEQFDSHYAAFSSPAASAAKSSGGDFYATLPYRASRRFVRALVASTLEGVTLYRDAFQMLGISSTKTFTKIAEKVGGTA